MRKTFTSLLAAIFAAGLAAPAFAEEVTQAEIDRIVEVLADMKCEVDTDEIEKEEDGYELDDVFCQGEGQFDIDLNLDFEVTNKKAE